MKIDNFAIIASFNDESACKLINRINVPGLHLLILSLPGSVLRTHVESLSKPRDSTSVVEALPGKLDLERHSLLFAIYSFTFRLALSSSVSL